LPRSVRDPTHRWFGERQWRQLLAGVWQSTRAFWVNDPVRDEVASRKAYQLAVARSLGLAVPRTLVTSDPRRARSFVRSCGVDERGRRAITKIVHPEPGAARETRRVCDQDHAALVALRHVPFFLQQYVDGVDLRVTIVGREVFAAELDARKTAFPDDFRIDWSHGGSLLRRTRLPAPIRRGLLALMDHLGLEFGAVDLRRTDAGEHVFLEVNAAGHWLFVESATGLPITDAVAELLARGGSRRRAP
jgi:glutathione synthase/RimK-type ligase-like ATP-grasp enzyme